LFLASIQLRDYANGNVLEHVAFHCVEVSLVTLRTLFILSLVLCFDPHHAEAKGKRLELAAINWPPIYGQNIPKNGFFTELCREAYRRAGYDIKLIFLPWSRVIYETKKGKYDGVLGAYYNDERSQHFIYSDVVIINEEIFIRREETKFSSTALDVLKRHRVVALRGSAQAQELINAGFAVDEVTSHSQSISMLLAKRHDLALVGKPFYLHYLLHEGQNNKDKLAIINPPFKSYQLFTLLSRKRKNAHYIMKQFNAALQQMKDDGTYAEIIKRLN